MNTEQLVNAGKQVGMLVLGIVAGETVSDYLVKKALPSTMSDTMKHYVPFGLSLGTLALSEMTETFSTSPEMKTMARGFAAGCANNGLRGVGMYGKINATLGLSGFAGNEEMNVLGFLGSTDTGEDIFFEDEAYLERDDFAVEGLEGQYGNDYNSRTNYAELGTAEEVSFIS